jgi:hypothetical protein
MPYSSLHYGMYWSSTENIKPIPKIDYNTYVAYYQVFSPDESKSYQGYLQKYTPMGVLCSRIF